MVCVQDLPKIAAYAQKFKNDGRAKQGSWPRLAAENVDAPIGRVVGIGRSFSKQLCSTFK